MKKLIAILTFSTTLSASAFYLNANCEFNRAEGRCVVYNRTNGIIFCSLQAQGLLSNGMYANAWENVTVYPGQSAYVRIFATNPNYSPLINVTGSAQCRF